MQKIEYIHISRLHHEMSDEELLMQRGTHPLFRKAKDLIAEYEKEANENG